MSKAGSTAAGIIVSALIVVSVGAIGYYQFEIAPSLTSSSVITSGPSNIRTVKINITVGAAFKTTDAYVLDVVKLVIGVNNSVVFYNGDVQAGVGTPHTATARIQVGGKPVFDTGILMAGDTSGALVITTPGTFDYYCQLHPTTMRGTVIVTAKG